MRYEGFWLISLDADRRARTCGYWYLIQTHGCTAHTAFRSKAALLLWLGERAITPTAHIPDPGQHSAQRLLGAYEQVYCPSPESFHALHGVYTASMHNARYVPAKITTAKDGLRTIHIAHWPEAPELDRALLEPHYCGPWGESNHAYISASAP